MPDWKMATILQRAKSLGAQSEDLSATHIFALTLFVSHPRNSASRPRRLKRAERIEVNIYARGSSTTLRSGRNDELRGFMEEIVVNRKVCRPTSTILH